MNKEVYKHILQTYGRLPGLWFGFTAELVRTVLMRVVTLLILAQLATNLAMGDVTAAKRDILYFLLTGILAIAIGTVGDLASLRAENKRYHQMILVFYHKLAGKDMNFYRNNQTGYLVSLFRQHVDSVLLLVRLVRGQVSRVAVSLTAPVVVLFFADWRLGLVTVGIIVVQIVYIMWSSARVNPYRKVAHEVYRKLTGEVADVITNIVAFKSAGAGKQVGRNISALAEEETLAYNKRRSIPILLDAPRAIITTLSTSAAFWVITTNGANNAQTVGLMVLAITYMFQITRNVSELPDLITSHDDLVTKIYPTLKYLGDVHEGIKDPTNPAELIIKKGDISISQVDFGYPTQGKSKKRVAVFKNLNIRIRGGEQVGVVGLSGAGKSTLASLLMRFDDIDAGEIKIDGLDIRHVRQSDLHRKIAYVPQEPLLFHRSIRENIAYFNPTANDRNVQRAAKAAHAHEFITTLPDGYDSLVGERGVKLSGGQKQRVVIARAILKNAPIMIFDEATSALDSESEQIIQRALPEIIGKHTAIVIAHRLSTIAGLDRIIVMHQGKVVEEGTHAQLLKLRGRYHSLWQKQTNNDQ